MCANGSSYRRRSRRDERALSVELLLRDDDLSTLGLRAYARARAQLKAEAWHGEARDPHTGKWVDAGGSQHAGGAADYPTHTGDSKADALIAEFRSYHGSVPNSGYEYDVAKLGDPEYAKNMCKTVAQAFARWMKRQGYQAKAEWGVAAEIYPKQSPKGLHNIVTLRTGSGEFIVDWAAAQYGVNKGRIPAVQPRGSIELGSLFDMEDRARS